MNQSDNSRNTLVRRSLIERAQVLAVRHSETGINPDKFFLFTTPEIAGIVAYLKRIHSKEAE